jgi:hypothetical protein
MPSPQQVHSKLLPHSITAEVPEDRVAVGLPPPELCAARISKLLRLGDATEEAGQTPSSAGMALHALDGDDVGFGIPELDMLVLHLKADDLCGSTQSGVPCASIALASMASMTISVLSLALYSPQPELPSPLASTT